MTKYSSDSGQHEPIWTADQNTSTWLFSAYDVTRNCIEHSTASCNLCCNVIAEVNITNRVLNAYGTPYMDILIVCNS